MPAYLILIFKVLTPFKSCEHKVVLQIRKILPTPEIRKQEESVLLKFVYQA